VTEADGAPVAAVVAPANVHDSMSLQDILEAVVLACALLWYRRHHRLTT